MARCGANEDKPGGRNWALWENGSDGLTSGASFGRVLWLAGVMFGMRCSGFQRGKKRR